MENRDNMTYIGISEDRLHHIVGVARRCYEISKELGYNEDFCRRMFMIGWNHDVGYEFSTEQTEHPLISESLLKLIGVTDTDKSSSKVLHSIRKHGLSTSIKSAEWLILNIADLTIDSKGSEIDVIQRLDDIKSRYGEHSNQYLTACDVAYQVKLTDVNLAES